MQKEVSELNKSLKEVGENFVSWAATPLFTAHAGARRTP